MTRTTMDPALRAAVRAELERLPVAKGDRRPLGRSTRPGRFRPRVLASLGACAAVAGVVTVLVAAPPSAPNANAEAILERAALHASSSREGGAGSVVEFVERTLDQVDTDGESGPDVASVHDGVRMLKIPEAGEPWVRKTWTTSSRSAYGDPALLPAAGSTSTEQHPSFQTSATGAFVDEPASRASAPLGEYPASIRDLPRDPQELLAALRAAHDPSEPSSGSQVLRAASTVLSSGVADGELQAAVFAALQDVPDLTVVDRHATDLDGRTGVAIGLRAGTFDPRRTADATELLIDPATGRYLGERTISLLADGVVPAGAELYQVAMTAGLPAKPAAWRLPSADRLLTYP